MNLFFDTFQNDYEIEIYNEQAEKIVPPEISTYNLTKNDILPLPNINDLFNVDKHLSDTVLVSVGKFKNFDHFNISLTLYYNHVTNTPYINLQKYSMLITDIYQKKTCVISLNELNIQIAMKLFTTMNFTSYSFIQVELSKYILLVLICNYVYLYDIKSSFDGTITYNEIYSETFSPSTRLHFLGYYYENINKDETIIKEAQVNKCLLFDILIKKSNKFVTFILDFSNSNKVKVTKKESQEEFGNKYKFDRFVVTSSKMSLFIEKVINKYLVLNRDTNEINELICTEDLVKNSFFIFKSFVNDIHFLYSDNLSNNNNTLNIKINELCYDQDKNHFKCKLRQEVKINMVNPKEKIKHGFNMSDGKNFIVLLRNQLLVFELNEQTNLINTIHKINFNIKLGKFDLNLSKAHPFSDTQFSIVGYNESKYYYALIKVDNKKGNSISLEKGFDSDEPCSSSIKLSNDNNNSILQIDDKETNQCKINIEEHNSNTNTNTNTNQLSNNNNFDKEELISLKQNINVDEKVLEKKLNEHFQKIQSYIDTKIDNVVNVIQNQDQFRNLIKIYKHNNQKNNSFDSVSISSKHISFNINGISNNNQSQEQVNSQLNSFIQNQQYNMNGNFYLMQNMFSQMQNILNVQMANLQLMGKINNPNTPITPLVNQLNQNFDNNNSSLLFPNQMQMFSPSSLTNLNSYFNNNLNTKKEEFSSHDMIFGFPHDISAERKSNLTEKEEEACTFKRKKHSECKVNLQYSAGNKRNKKYN